MVDDTRERVLDGALGVVSSIGLARLTVDDVARAAGVSRQTVYRYFGSRDGLIRAVILREEQALLARLGTAVEGHDQALPALKVALQEALVAAAEHPLLRRLLDSEPEALLPYLLRNDSPVLSAALPVVEALLVRFAPHLTEHELAAVGDMATRLLVSYVVSPSGESHDEVAGRVAELVAASLKI